MQALILALHEEDQHSKLVAESLRKSGHKVILCKNFAQAVSVLESRVVDLIVSDVHLENGGNVFDFLKWVRQNPSTLTTPFVLLSCDPSERAKYLDDALKTTARLLGAAMYITMETFNSEDFRTLIDSLLPKADETKRAKTTGKGE